VPYLLRFVGFLLILAASVPAGANEPPAACPETLRNAKRLLVVVAATMDARVASVRIYERSSQQANWNEVGNRKPAVLGRNGLAWGWDQKYFARPEEPIKHEGDFKTPAGIYPVGRAFGFAAHGPGQDYLRLQKAKTFCVDDVRSPHYNSIISKTLAGEHVTGEDMASIPLYRKGLLVGFPTNRADKGGSCIFIHVWRAPGSSTSGCVALREDDVAQIQDWASKDATFTLILPQQAVARFHECLPGIAEP
jgi:L,D-peptidoglycan transpeptidase YkuD (ErfK/YbiS/YcfS/YnhG family)